MPYHFNFRVVFAYSDLLAKGAWLTVQLSATTMVLGLLIAIVCALVKTARIQPFLAVVNIYVETVRNTPLLIQLFLIFFGLPSLGIRLRAEEAAVLAMTINVGAYTTEIVRSGIESIHKSQVEAGLSLGLSRLQVFRYVILFPALKKVYPSLTSQFILLLLASSLVSQISAEELFHIGAFIDSRTFQSFEVYLVITFIYLGLSLMFRFVFYLINYFVFVRR